MDPNELARYRSHKIVRAGRIWAILGASTGGANLEVESARGEWLPAQATASMLARFRDGGRDLETGDFFLIYEDGYESLSPKDAFEGGYGRLDE